MKAHIAVLAGDGIGPEIMRAALLVLDAVNKKFGHEITYTEGLVGGDAYDKYGDPLPSETLQLCEKSDAILFGAVGGPVEEGTSERWRDVEKKVILGLRKHFDLFANLRPLKIWPQTIFSSPLKEDIVRGMDILIIRELVSGIYFGEHKTFERGGETVAHDVNYYAASEIERLVRVGFDAARKRKKQLTLVDKANVLDTSRLWRRITEKINGHYADIAVQYMYIDNAAMQLVRDPSTFDVIMTENMFGDILSDLGGALVGSIGLLPSASLNTSGFGMYEPVHGSAPDIAGKGIANPAAQILSLAMLLRYSFGLADAAADVESAIESVFSQGTTTRDLAVDSQHWVDTITFAEHVALEMQKNI